MKPIVQEGDYAESVGSLQSTRQQSLISGHFNVNYKVVVPARAALRCGNNLEVCDGPFLTKSVARKEVFSILCVHGDVCKVPTAQIIIQTDP